MPSPTIPLFAKGERPTAEKLNSIFSSLSNMFGGLVGADFSYPMVLSGDLDMDGNRLLGVRELFGVLNINEFGSDTAAFDDAVASLSGGGLIFIPRNTTITLSRGIKIGSTRKRVYIMGCGASSVLKLDAGADDAVIAMDGASRFVISNLTIDGNADNNSSGVGVQCRDCREFEIRNLWIGGGPSTGMAGDGLYMDNSKNFSIKRCWVKNPRAAGVRIDGCSDFLVSQVTVDSSSQPSVDGDMVGGDHFSIQGESTSGRIESSSSLHSPNGCFYVTGGDHITIGPGNFAFNWNQSGLHDNNVVAIAMVGKGGGKDTIDPSEGLVAIGNHMDGNNTAKTAGVGINGTVRGQVIGNSVRRQTGLKAWVNPDTDIRVDFRNNMVMDVASHGKHSFLSGAATTKLTLGEAGLPISSIQATWNVTTGTPITLKNSVIGCRYSGKTVTFYNASAIAGVTDFWYSIEV